jgi:hydrogenase expression/formation protein HypE
MRTGKLTNEELKKIVLERLPICSTDISKGPAVGLDCAIINSHEGFMVVSSDPITGASSDIGSIAIHVSCNDIACAGIKPVAIMLVVIAPSNATREDLIHVIEQASEAAKEIGIDIVGGHTEVSDAVNRFILMTTAFGFSDRETAISAAGAKPGDSILMTKYAAQEGSAILAADFRERLSAVLTEKESETAMNLIKNISVVKEGVLCGQLKVHAMHDATEGGILGAVWEISEASGAGCRIDLSKVPVLPETKKICTFLGLNPYALISSGSMIIATQEPERILLEMSKNGILCSEIGKIIEKDRQYIDMNGQIHELSPPEADELYKIK